MPFEIRPTTTPRDEEAGAVLLRASCGSLLKDVHDPHLLEKALAHPTRPRPELLASGGDQIAEFAILSARAQRIYGR